MLDWKHVLTPNALLLTFALMGAPAAASAQQAVSRSNSPGASATATDSAVKLKADTTCAAVIQAAEAELQKKRNELRAQSKDTAKASVSVAKIPGYDTRTVIRCLRGAQTSRPKPPAGAGQPAATPQAAKPADSGTARGH